MARRAGLLVLRANVDRLPGLMAELQAWLALLGVGTEPSEPGPAIAPGVGHVQTELSEDGRILAGGSPAPRDLSDAIKRYFPEDVWTDAARVSYIESAGWQRKAERNTLDQAGGRCNVPLPPLPDGTHIVSEQSVGYFQINVCAHGGDREYWWDADNNVRKAVELYRESGWRPWIHTARQLKLV